MAAAAVSEPAAVGRLLRRVSLEGLREALPALPGLSAGEAERLRHAVASCAARPALVRAAVGALRRGLSAAQEEALDLRAAHEGSRVRRWTAWRLDGADASAAPPPPAELRGRLASALGAYFRARVAYAVAGGAVWLRAAAPGAKPVYVVHFPRTPFVLASPVPRARAEFVEAAVARAFGAPRLAATGLEGASAADLGEMLARRHSQGRDRALREQGEDADPLARRRRAAKRPARPDAGLLVRDGARDEKRRRRYAADVFGKEGGAPLPALPRVRLATSLSLAACAFGDDDAARDEEAAAEVLPGTTVRCELTLEGPSVLEGLRQMVSQGLAVAPLPRVLANLHSSARSNFHVSGRTLNSADGHGESEDEDEDEDEEAGEAAEDAKEKDGAQAAPLEEGGEDEGRRASGGKAEAEDEPAEGPAEEPADEPEPAKEPEPEPVPAKRQQQEEDGDEGADEAPPSPRPVATRRSTRSSAKPRRSPRKSKK